MERRITRVLRKSKEEDSKIKPYHPPTSLTNYVVNRQYGHKNVPIPYDETNDFISRQLPGLLKEREYDLGECNKIFAAQWLDSNQVVFGTKCNSVSIKFYCICLYHSKKNPTKLSKKNS